MIPTTFKKRPARNGFTVIELMMVVIILSIVASIIAPRFFLLTQHAYQSKARSNLGALRSALAIYYTDNEGKWPLSGTPGGYAYTTGTSLSDALIPKYTAHIPPPKLDDLQPDFNGTGLLYDDQAIVSMGYSPPHDVFITFGAPHTVIAANAPFGYDPNEGLVYYFDDNFDLSGQEFFNW